MAWRRTERLMEAISHYATFPATGVSLRQMVQFGEKPSPGTLFRASQFLSEELPIRLAHRVEELENLPDGLNEMPSIRRVQDWYAQSFEEITELPRPTLSSEVRNRLMKAGKNNGGRQSAILSAATQNPSVKKGQYQSAPIFNGHDEHHTNHNHNHNNGHRASAAFKRYYVPADDGKDWPPELQTFNLKFAETLEKIKRRHDSVVTTVAQGILEWKRNHPPAVDLRHLDQSEL